MSHLDDVLAEIAEKLENGIDAVLAQVAALEEEAKTGRVRPETIARLKESAERLHKTVDEEIDEGEPEEEHEEPEHH